MKTKLLRPAKYVTLLLLLLLAGYGCSDDDIVETEWKIANITIEERDWTWNHEVGRYEAVVEFPELTEFIYENGAHIGYVFIGTQGVDEVQKQLPYVHTYWEDDGEGGEILYTETLSYDVQYGYGTGSTIAFYIQASDLFRNDDILADYNFRVAMIY